MSRKARGRRSRWPDFVAGGAFISWLIFSLLNLLRAY